MKIRFERERREQLKRLMTDLGPDESLGRNYEADEDLEAAVNVALILNRPLLVSGAPGCGKTQLGYAIARNLGIERVYFFSVKSTSEARDLFYGYDAIGRFQAVQIAAAERPISDSGRPAPPPPNVGDYIEYRALGAAILDAHQKEDVSHLLVGRYEHPGWPRRSVVIIDEIDKAPRDFPNDLLDEVDRMKFRVPELLQWTRAMHARAGLRLAGMTLIAFLVWRSVPMIICRNRSILANCPRGSVPSCAGSVAHRAVEPLRTQPRSVSEIWNSTRAQELFGAKANSLISPPWSSIYYRGSCVLQARLSVARS